MSPDVDITKIEKKTTAIIKSVDDYRNSIIVSRREVLAKDNASAINNVVINSIIDCKVTGIAKFGAFVATRAGVTGLLHISNIANRKIENIADELTVGQDLRVKVLKIDKKKNQINVGLRQLAVEDPKPESTTVKPKPIEDTGQKTTANTQMYNEYQAAKEDSKKKPYSW